MKHVLIFGLSALLSNLAYISPDSGAESGKFPVLSVDREIDNLGTDIKSQDDAAKYVSALFSKFGLDETRDPVLRELKLRLIQAEYRAVIHLEKRVPESGVVDVYNNLMDLWSAPPGTRISAQEFHGFRVLLSATLFPRSSGISRHVGLPPACRPVEALYLIYLLQSQGGVPSELRFAIKSGREPESLFRDRIRPVHSEVHLELRPSSARGSGVYFLKRREYFSQRTKVDVVRELDHLFLQLGI